MNVHPSGYYAWQHQPLSARALEDQRLLGQIKQCWLESGGIYGYRKIRDDLREMGETCGKHRVARLMRHEGFYVHKPVIAAVPVIMVAGQRWLHRTILNASSM
ncbi:hypothetical protein WP2S18C03_27370 [Aeromonas veronii]|nr:hypothetical protein WP2S18C03_27370 [Aeromonas veronii]